MVGAVPGAIQYIEFWLDFFSSVKIRYGYGKDNGRRGTYSSLDPEP